MLAVGWQGLLLETLNCITLADENTVLPNTDAWFDGLSIYVVLNDKNLALGEYVKQEKEALLEQRKAMVGQESSPSGTEAPITIGGQKGLSLQGYSWDHIIRIYVPFPDNQAFLVIGKSEKSEGSFKVFNQILSTFQFARQ